MKRDLRVTIRNPDPELLESFRSIAIFNQIALGVAFNEAVETWINSLDEVDEVSFDARDE